MKRLIKHIRELNGSPRYVARGMAIGVFVGITPTIPFHTVLALALAFTFRASKPAAVIGAWIANPVTIPFFYMASYQASAVLFVNSVVQKPDIRALIRLCEQPIPPMERMALVSHFFVNHVDMAWKILAGGVILGIIPAILSYALTLRAITSYSRLHEKKEIRI